MDNRQGVDLFFVACVFAACLFWGVKQSKFAPLLCLPIIWNLFVIDDFNQYYALSETIIFSSGLLFIAYLYSHKKLINEFHTIIVALAFVGMVYDFLHMAGLDLKMVIAENLLTGVKALKVHSYGNYDGGFLGNPNVSGAFYALSIFSFWKKGLKWLSLAPFAMTFFTTAFPIITAVAFYIMLAWQHLNFSPKTGYAAFLVLFGAFYLYGHSNNLWFYNGPKDELLWHDSGRFLIWENSTEMLINSKNWLMGNGLGWFGDNFKSLYKPFGWTVKQEHNEFFAVLNAFGLVGLLSFMGIFFYLSSGIDKITNAGLFACFVNFMGNFTLHISTTFIVCALILVCALKGKNIGEIVERESLS